MPKDETLPLTSVGTRIMNDGPMDYVTARPSGDSAMVRTGTRVANDASPGTTKRPSNDAPLS
jgi:hypothetical protein